MKSGVAVNKIASFWTKITSFAIFFWMTRFWHKFVAVGFCHPAY
jgi:hypothetical protein